MSSTNLIRLAIAFVAGLLLVAGVMAVRSPRARRLGVFVLVLAAVGVFVAAKLKGTVKRTLFFSADATVTIDHETFVATAGKPLEHRALGDAPVVLESGSFRCTLERCTYLVLLPGSPAVHLERVAYARREAVVVP